MPSVLSPDALTTLDNLKNAVGVATADTSKDNHLERCINRATGVIEDMTGRKFNGGTQGGLKARKYNGASGSHTTTGITSEDYVYFSGYTRDCGGDTCVENGCGVFHLPAYPVRANDEAQSDAFALAILSTRGSGTGETWDTTSYVEFDQFVVDRQNGVLRLLGGPFAAGHRNYRVTMAAGFLYGAAQPYVPPDLEALCVEIAKGIYRDNRAVIGESIGSWSRQYSVTMLQEDQLTRAVLARYSRPVL